MAPMTPIYRGNVIDAHGSQYIDNQSKHVIVWCQFEYWMDECCCWYLMSYVPRLVCRPSSGRFLASLMCRNFIAWRCLTSHRRIISARYSVKFGNGSRKTSPMSLNLRSFAKYVAIFLYAWPECGSNGSVMSYSLPVL